jgi:hypothetical protein
LTIASDEYNIKPWVWVSFAIGIVGSLIISEAGHVHKGFFEASDSLEFRTGSTSRHYFQCI